MSRLPKKPLDQVAVVSAGDPAPQGAESFSPDGDPFVRMQDVGRCGRTDNLIETADRINPTVALQLKRFPRGSILVPKSGASIRLNHRAILGIDAFVVSHLAVIIPKPEMNARYLYYWLCSVDLSKIAHETDFPSLRLSDLARMEAPCPPVEEQEETVRLLDEAEGLRKLRAESDHRTADLIPALFHEMFGDYVKNPVQLLSDVSEVVSGIAKGRHLEGKQTVTVPYLRVANVQAGHLDLTAIKTIEALPSEVDYLSLRHGDVLLTEGGDFDKLGRAALWEHDLENCIHQNHIFRVRPLQDVLNSVFLTAYLQNPKAREYFLQCAKRTTNLASINMTQLRNLPVPIPPIERQNWFAARIVEFDGLKSQQLLSHGRLDDLFQSLLYRAFQGEL
jgi:type I restriction enzyme S subunit